MRGDEDEALQELDQPPFVMAHGDFHAGDIIVRDGHIVGVIDWEFAGSYPLSEAIGEPDLTYQDRNSLAWRYQRNMISGMRSSWMLLKPLFGREYGQTGKLRLLWGRASASERFPTDWGEEDEK